MKKTGKVGGLGVLILAAGQGTRMQSTLPKVLHPIGGRPLLYYILRLANALKPSGIGLVVGYEEDRVRKEIGDSLKSWGVTRPVTFIRQKPAPRSGGAGRAPTSVLRLHPPLPERVPLASGTGVGYLPG